MPPPNYTDLRKLDEETLEKLQEGSGPVDECLCSILAPPLSSEGSGKGFKASIKRAIGSLASAGRERRKPAGRTGGPEDQESPRLARVPAGGRPGSPRMVQGAKGGNTLEIPLYAEGKGWAVKKEVVARKTPCGRCGCDKEKFVLKHAYANIRVTTPDISTLCPCPGSNCMPGKETYNDNIQITVEQATCQSDPDTLDSETDLYGFFKAKEQKPPEPNLAIHKRSVTSLIEDAHDEEYKSGFYRREDFDNWSDKESDK